jgi:hypothetical protein
MKPSKPKREAKESPTRLHVYDSGVAELTKEAPAAKVAMAKIQALGRKHLERT